MMWSLSSQATLALSPSTCRKCCIQSGSKPSNNKPFASHQLPRWMSQQSPRSRFTSGNTGGGYRLVLSIGLIAGGAFTAYRYVTSNKVRREEAVLASSEMRGLVASCREGDGKSHSASESSRKFERAIKRSRDLLQRAKDEVGAPGIVAAVSVDGNLVWSEGIGYADVENRTPCRPNSVFRIASISKALAMTAAARLMEEGKLDLDKPVQEYVPSFPQKEWDGEKVSLTTRHLVSHLGGIRHYDKSYMKKKKTDDNKTAEDNQMDKQNSNKISKIAVNETNNKTKSKEKIVENSTTFDEMKSKKEFKNVNSALDLFKDDPLMHKPGSKYMYTTHGFTLLSAVVEGASGKDFLTYMRTMLRDMGLTETIPDRHIPIIYNRARGYRYNKNGKLENCPYVDLSYKWAGGGYLSTVEDLIKFGNIMLYSFQHTDNHTDKALVPGFLKKDTVEAIWKPVPIAKPKPTNEYCYAMGWSVLEKEKKHGHCRPMRHIVAHSGGAMGFTSILTIAPNHISSEINSTTGNNSETKNRDVPDMSNETELSSASHLPKGVVVALFVNLLDAGLSKPAEGIVEAFQQCTNGE